MNKIGAVLTVFLIFIIRVNHCQLVAGENPLIINYLSTEERRDVFQTFKNGYEVGKLSIDEFQEYIQQIGINGVMDVVQKHENGCEVDGSNIGTAAVGQTTNLHYLTVGCRERCQKECIYGVISGNVEQILEMGEKNLNNKQIQNLFEYVTPQFGFLCNNTDIQLSIPEGECAYAVGCSLPLYINSRDGLVASEVCFAFLAPVMQNYCGKGVYYYVYTNEKSLREDATTAPCENAKLPGSCWSIKWQYYKDALLLASLLDPATQGDLITDEMLSRVCYRVLHGQLSCIFGLAIWESLAKKYPYERQYCSKYAGAERYACMEGYLLYAKGSKSAGLLCDEWDDMIDRKACRDMITWSVFSLNRDVSLFTPSDGYK